MKLTIARAPGVWQSVLMEQQRVIRILQDHEAELKTDGVLHLSVFGSVARGEASSDSDVDILADLDASRRFTLVTLGRLESRLTDLLGVKVDLSSPAWMPQPVREQALREAVLAF